MLTEHRAGERTPPASEHGADRHLASAAAARHETELERADRNLSELLQELRVAQTGIQVLFAFLLTIAFRNRFETITGFERIDYFVTLVAAGTSAILLIAPSAHHRILFRQGDKEYLVTTANRLTLLGLAAMAVTITGGLLLITDYLFNSLVAAIVSALTAAFSVCLWFVWPLARRRALTRELTTLRSPTPTAAAGESAPPRLGSRGPTRP